MHSISGCKNASLTLILILLAIVSQSLMAVDNPVSYDRRINDCDVLKYNGRYYIIGNWLNGSMLVSDDLENWGQETHVYSWDNQWHSPRNENPDMSIHAPHLRYHNGFFHLYVQLDVYDGIAHAVSRCVWGPYEEPVKEHAFVSGTVIDADVFVDEDGQWYFYCDQRHGVNGHEIQVYTMSDPWTVSDTYQPQIYASGGWEGNVVNEASKVFKYRDRYYMLYNANSTGNPNYAIGCVEASSPTGFTNRGKYGYPIISRKVPAPGAEEVAFIGQAWVVDGLNGFEKWLGYFGQTRSLGRTQRIERMHFFDRKLHVDGPTVKETPGYHPGPARPQLLSLFNQPDGPIPADDWNLITEGSWSVSDFQAHQADPNTKSLNLVNRQPATNYLFEANLRFAEPRDSFDKAGVIAYYRDPDNYVLVGLDRSAAGDHDNWYMHVRQLGVDTVHAGDFDGSIDYSAYHKIRVTKNGSYFDLRINDVIPPDFSVVKTAFEGTGRPGLFTDHTTAYFDGVIYTIGWDEFDSSIAGWADSLNAMAGYTDSPEGVIPKTGIWTYEDDGIKMAKGTGRIFKGDLMPKYEFSAQVYKVARQDGRMGVVAAKIDPQNYILAQIDTDTSRFYVSGIKDGQELPTRTAEVEYADNYNIRVVKLPDGIIFFVDGHELMTYPVSFGPSQVGLAVDDMSARFNGIGVYQFEPKEDADNEITQNH